MLTDRKLGKLPARRGATKFAFAKYFDAKQLPVPPRRFGHGAVGPAWGTLANDKYACCVWSGAAHETMALQRAAARPQVAFRDTDVLADYAEVTGFEAARPDSDAGTGMQEAASYRRKTGVRDAGGTRHQIDSYVSLRTGRESELALAAYLTGVAGVGIQLPSTAMSQFDAQVPWTVEPGGSLLGGHYVACVGRNTHGHFLIVTWGRLHAMTPEFYAEYSDEAMGYISLEVLDKKGLTPDGFDLAALKADLAKLTT